jgi:AcrR family transcriptional regulator
MTDSSLSDRAETALVALLAERSFHEIGFADIAAKAGIDLADLRRLYDRPIDVLSGFARRIDVAVLAGGDPETAATSRRDRLFDALMRRFDLLVPYRAGLCGLARSARTDPILAAKLVGSVVGSQRWMLEAAGIATGGLVGGFRAPALAAGLARVVPVFLAEDDAGLPKTMKALDETLTTLGRVEARVEGFFDRCRAWRRPAPKPEEAYDPSI